METNKPDAGLTARDLDNLIEDWTRGGSRRIKAEAEFHCFSPEQVAALMHRLTERRLRRESPMTLVMLVAFPCMMAVRFVDRHSFILDICLAAYFIAIALLLGVHWMNYQERPALFRVIWRNRCGLANLFESVHSYNDKVRVESRKALIELLPKVTGQDISYIDATVRAHMHQALLNQPPSLVLPLLKALEIIGDGRDIEPVQRLARYRMGMAAKSVGVRKAANELLPILRERAEEERVSGKLLRPSDRPEEEGLLRPASTGAEGEAETLLRAVETPGNS